MGNERRNPTDGDGASRRIDVDLNIVPLDPAQTAALSTNALQIEAKGRKLSKQRR